ncbi:MAG: cellulase family glycosylhydrolase, partial [Spirochaetales bacterium]|nr:cellulase family glycosylhydrolase [Spirochaetales bacterium]
MRQYRTDYFAEARNAGLQYIRFGPNFLPAHEKDFLFGDLDHFSQINREDLQLLLRILDDAHENGIGIVLTMFALPGQRYGNPQETEMDTRLWKDEKYWKASFDFWKQLAALVKDHPAIVAYNPLNEPVAAYAYGYKYPSRGFRKWLVESAGTAADLNLFNTLMIQAIREVDPETPIMLDGYFWSSPTGMPYMDAQKDPNILYAFHNPGPWNFSSLEANQGRYSYPDAMPRFWTGSLTEKWESEDLERLVNPVETFIEANGIEEYRIIASEFWCNRRINGCAAYLQDLMDLYDRNNWHWGFWCFRPDSGYTGYDYQLGDAPDSGNYIVKTLINHEDPESARNRSFNP